MPVPPVNLNQHAFNVHHRVQSLDLIPGKCCNLRRHGALLETSETSEQNAKLVTFLGGAIYRMHSNISIIVYNIYNEIKVFV